MEKQTQIFELPTLDLAQQGWRLSLLKELHGQGRLNNQEILRIELALQEAVTNSLEHGNLGLKSEWKDELDLEGIDRFTREKKQRLQDPQYAARKVKIVVECSEESLDVTITDEGDGFAAEIRNPSNQTQSYGRGLMIILSSMDDVSFGDNGKVIRMRKKLSLANV